MAYPDFIDAQPIWEAPRDDPRAERMRDPAIAGMLAADNHISILTVALYWAWELSDRLRPKELALSFAEFLLGGGADNAAGTVLVFDKKSGRVRPRSGREWGERVVKLATENGEAPREILWLAIRDELLGVKREAVWAYCEAAGLPPPSFWPRPATAQAPPKSAAATAGGDEPQPGIVTQLTRFMNSGGRMSNQAAYDSCVDEFGSDVFTWREFGAARVAVDQANKLGRGKKK